MSSRTKPSSSVWCASHPWKRRCSRYPFCSSYLGEGGRSTGSGNGARELEGAPWKAFPPESPDSSASAASPSPICAGPDWPLPPPTPPEGPAASPTRSRPSSQASRRAFAAAHVEGVPSSSGDGGIPEPAAADADAARSETRAGGWNGEGGGFTSSGCAAGSSGVAGVSRGRFSGSGARPRRRAYRSTWARRGGGRRGRNAYRGTRRGALVSASSSGATRTSSAREPSARESARESGNAAASFVLRNDVAGGAKPSSSLFEKSCVISSSGRKNAGASSGRFVGTFTGTPPTIAARAGASRGSP